MSIFYYILMAYCISAIIVAIAFITAKPYPEEWEEQEDKELKNKFDEHKKSQED